MTPPSPHQALARLAHEESGITLMEVLVAAVISVVVVAATFAILEFSVKQSTRIADRTSANQRGRGAMEKIINELHSSCVTILVNPIQEGSEPNKLVFLSQTAPNAEAYFTSMTRREIFLEGTTLKEGVYNSTAGSEAVAWKFSALSTTPNTTNTLLTGVSAPSTGSMFEYLKYTGTSLSTLLPSPDLTEKEAKLVSQVNIHLVVAPESGSTAGPSGDRQVELSDSAVLRLTPATEVGVDEPCE
jgi:Tfp pilus assembly protein PilW